MFLFSNLFFWLIIFLILISLRQVNQYQRGVRFTFGRFTGISNPGWRIVLPIIQSMTKVDIRTKAVEVPYQDAITKDNVSCKINAVIYYRVADAGRSVIEVENVWNAVSQLAQTTMRNVVGELTLDELLSERDQASHRISELIASHTADWGIEVKGVELKDIDLPEDMKRVIARQAEAEREKRAVIIQSEGEVAAAENLRKAAGILSENAAALHLRTLATLTNVADADGNTVIWALPLEILRAFERWNQNGIKKT